MQKSSANSPIPPGRPPIINIALVGGKELCIELLQKTTLDRDSAKLNAQIVAVADPNPECPGMVAARGMGLKTTTDYYDLYDPSFDIHLIILLIPSESILEEIISTRPGHIRILSYEVFTLFWEAIGWEERKLRERNREVEAIINGIQDFIFVIDPERKITDVNDAFLQKMEYRRDEVLGKKCHEVFQGASQQCSSDEVVCPLSSVLRNKTPARSVRTWINKKGELRYIEITIFPIWRENGKISEFIEISRDITDQKKADEEITRRLEKLVEERTRQLKETHEQLIHQDKMASLGKLAASVVHEVNNPNAGILNLIMLMKRIIREGPVAAKEMEQFNRYLDLMEAENRRISRIVSNLLVFSRQTGMTLNRLDLNHLVEKTLLLNANLLKISGVKVKKQMDANLPEFTGSEDQLQQVFMNLISNAAEALGETRDAVLTIKTHHVLKKGMVVISFEDNGVGIPDENHSKLFEPFFTTKKKGKGVGLGLSVAYGIVQDHGGVIRVKSKAGEGSRFTVELPLETDLGNPARQPLP